MTVVGIRSGLIGACAIAGIALALAGCGGGSSASAPPAEATPPAEVAPPNEVTTAAASTTAAQTEAAPESAAAVSDACSLLTPAEIEGVTGFPVEKGQPEPSVSPITCTWNVDDPTGGSSVVVDVLEGPIAAVALGTGDPGEKTVSGLGDEALYDSLSSTLYVRVGDRVLVLQRTVFSDPGATLDQATALAKLVLERL